MTASRLTFSELVGESGSVVDFANTTFVGLAGTTRAINGAFTGPVAPTDATAPQIVGAGTVTEFAVAGTITGADNVVFELENLDTPFATNPTVTLNTGNAGKAQAIGLTEPVAALDRIRTTRTDANTGTTIDEVSILVTLGD